MFNTHTHTQITLQVPNSPSDKILTFLESIGLNRNDDRIKMAMSICGGLDSVLCAISRDMYINVGTPGPSGGIDKLEVYSSKGGITYNEFTNWVVNKQTPHNGPSPEECTFCADSYCTHSYVHFFHFFFFFHHHHHASTTTRSQNWWQDLYGKNSLRHCGVRSGECELRLCVS